MFVVGKIEFNMLGLWYLFWDLRLREMLDRIYLVVNWGWEIEFRGCKNKNDIYIKDCLVVIRNLCK